MIDNESRTGAAYHPCPEDGGAAEATATDNGSTSDGNLVARIHLYSSFGSAADAPGFIRNNHEHSTILDPLVWGIVHFYIAPLVHQARALRELAWLPILMCYILIVYPPPSIEEKIGEEWIKLLAFAFFCLGYWWYGWVAYYHFTRRAMLVIKDEINASLEPLGYRAIYHVESTGICCSQVHRLCIYMVDSMVESLFTKELLQRIPPCQVCPEEERPTVSRQPQIVYLHGTPFQHLIWWQCNTTRPSFVSDDCPIEGIPICLWGTLQDACCVPRLGRVQNMSLSALGVWFCILSWGIMRGDNCISLLFFMSPGILAIVALSCGLLSSISRNVGHRQWSQAAADWDQAVTRYGWRMEYHRNDLQASFCTSPDFWLCFIPLHNDNVGAV